MMRRIVIGDIHSCYDELRALLDAETDFTQWAFRAMTILLHWLLRPAAQAAQPARAVSV